MTDSSIEKKPTYWHYRRYDLKRKYNLTIEQFDEMVREQNGQCKICFQSPPQLVIDHDHATKHIRGLLCSPCNLTLGLFGDNRVWLYRASVYLTQPPITYIRKTSDDAPIDLSNKICSTCAIKKPLDAFSKQKGGKLGHNSQCKECLRAKHKKWASENRAQINAYMIEWRRGDRRPVGARKPRIRKKDTKQQKRKWRMKSQFGLSMADLQAIYEKQNYECAICHIPESALSKALHLDHNHQTNAIRGLLCATCNLSLGQVSDNLQFFQNAIPYLDASVFGTDVSVAHLYKI